MFHAVQFPKVEGCMICHIACRLKHVPGCIAFCWPGGQWQYQVEFPVSHGETGDRDFAALAVAKAGFCLIRHQAGHLFSAQYSDKPPVAFASPDWPDCLDPGNIRDFDLAGGDWSEASAFPDRFFSDDAGYDSGHDMVARIDEWLARAKTETDLRPLCKEVERGVQVTLICHNAGVFMPGNDVRKWPADNVEQNRYSRNLCKVAVE